MDTDMADFVDPENKTAPAEVAAAALDGIQARSFEVLADAASRNTEAALSGGLELLYPHLFAGAGGE
jgi:hypothetical protein